VYSFTRIALIALVLLTTGPARADETDMAIDRALRLSGAAQQVGMIGRSILAAIPADAFPDGRTKRRADSLLKKWTRTDSLIPLIRDAIRTNLKREKLEQVLGFYESRLGRKVGRLAERALDPSVMKQVRVGRGIVARLSESRRSILQRIIKAEGVAEFNAGLLQSVIQGLMIGYVDTRGETARRMDEIRRKLETVESKIRLGKDRTEQIALAAFAHTFKSLKDEELEKLARYQESDAASWFREGVQKGLDRAVLRSSEALGRILAADMRRPRGKPSPSSPYGRGPTDPAII